MGGFVAEIPGNLAGIVHWITHRSCWTVGDYTNLQNHRLVIARRRSRRSNPESTAPTLDCFASLAMTVNDSAGWYYCYLQDLFVAPAHRGAGIGRALIEAVSDKARRLGCSRVHWLTHETNTNAMRLYDSIAAGRGLRLAVRRSPVPGLPPCREFRWPDLVAGEISFMQAQKFTFGDLAKPLAISRINIFLRPRAHMGGSPLHIHPSANDRADNLAQRLPMPQPEGVHPATAAPRRIARQTAHTPR
jgi:GNAT superfamily N-acetyltransferase